MNTNNIGKATDAQLCLRYHEGRDQRAFGELVKRHGPMVMATTRRVLDGHDDCLDAFQATFLALAKSVDRVRNRAAIAGWLHRAAHSSALEVRRSNSRWEGRRERMKEQVKVDSGSRTVTDATGPTQRIANAELAEILDEELAQLPDNLHAVIILCDLEGLSQKEAAARLGIPASTVNDRVTKARKVLAQRLIKRGVTLSLAALATCIAPTGKTASAMTPALVAGTTTKATLFVAGKTGTDVGVKDSIIQSANQVVIIMTKTKFSSIAIAALAIVATAGALCGIVGMQQGTARATTIFNETFDDGNLQDGQPVTWSTNAEFPAVIDISKGELHLSTLEGAPLNSRAAIEVAGLSVKDTSIRTRLRVERAGDLATVVTRSSISDEGEPQGYVAGVAYFANLGQSVVIAGRTDDSQTTEPFSPVSGGNGIVLPYDVRLEDTEIRLDMVGDNFKLWVWRANGGTMPEEPQFDSTDGAYSDPGTVAIVAGNFAGSGTGIVDFIEVEEVPEPKGAAIGLLGVVMCLTGFRHYWRRIIPATE